MSSYPAGGGSPRRTGPSLLMGGKSTGVRRYWMLLVGLGSAIVVIGIVLTIYKFAGEQSRKHHVTHINSGLAGVIVVIIGTACYFIARRLEKPLDGTSDAALATSYQTRFFLWIGFGELPAFIGIIAFVTTGQIWIYGLGAVFAFIAYAHLAPTKEHLDRDQAQLNHQGIGRSLRKALESTASARSR
jgi:chromate transport protein ChrA